VANGWRVGGRSVRDCVTPGLGFRGSNGVENSNGVDSYMKRKLCECYKYVQQTRWKW
jgi:hypothetical protein